MLGYIYKTTNLINNKIYIGQKQATKFNKNYYGSGKLLKQAIKKYGKENFKVEILEESNCEDLDNLEIKYIKEYNSTNLEIGYNILIGGNVSHKLGKNHPMYGKHHTNDSKRKISINTSIAQLGSHHSEETKNKISKANKGRIHSDESRRNMSNGVKLSYLNGRLHPMLGKHNNPGTIWINNGIINKRIYKEDLLKYADYKLGRIKWYRNKPMPNKAKENLSKVKKGGHWVCNKDNITKYVNFSDLEIYLQQGWQKGRKFKL